MFNRRTTMVLTVKLHHIRVGRHRLILLVSISMEIVMDICFDVNIDKLEIDIEELYIEKNDRIGKN